MRHLFTSFLFLFCALTANAALYVYVENTDQLLEQDTKITITEFKEEFGDLVATVSVFIHSDETTDLSATITRSNPAYDDTFCAGSNCVSTNHETTQQINFSAPSNPGPGEEMKIDIHYTAPVAGKETIAYTFSDKINPDITLTIDFDCQAMAINNIEADRRLKGVYTILGQYIAEEVTSSLPKGIYIVNGRKQVIH